MSDGRETSTSYRSALLQHKNTFEMAGIPGSMCHLISLLLIVCAPQGLHVKAEIFQNAAVATDVEVCSEMGRDILQRNGSAVDSAITSMLCVGLVNPESSGIGGGFFMVVYNRSSGRVEALDAQETAYAATFPEMLDGAGPDGGKYGMKNVAIPGEIRGMWDAHQRFGKLPWADLFLPVIDLARNGFLVGRHLASSLYSLRNSWDDFPALREWYNNAAENRVYEEGDVMTNPELADTLQAIADQGVEEFYTGPTATKMIQDIRQRGGNMTMADLANYTTIWTELETLRNFSRHNYTVFSSTLTSSGPFFQFMLRTLQDFKEFTETDLESCRERVNLFHKFVEVSKFAFAARTKLGAQWSEEVRRTMENLRSPRYAEHVRSLITEAYPYVFSTSSHSYVIDFNDTQVEESDEGDVGDTSHLSVLAPNGDAVAVTTSVGYYFGCKDVSNSTGIILNNHIRNFNFETKYQTWSLPANRLYPGNRPLSTMVPSVILDPAGDVKMVVGASGGLRIPTAEAWVILRTLLMNIPLDAAINEPRIQNYLLTNRATYERDFPQNVLSCLGRRHHATGYSSSYAVVQGILQTDEGIVAYSDPRKGGRAAGY